MARKQISVAVLKIFKEEEVREGYKLIYRVVRWGSNKPSFEIRVFYKEKDEWRAGRLKGFDVERFDWLKENYEEVKRFLEHAEEKTEAEKKDETKTSTDQNNPA